MNPSAFSACRKKEKKKLKSPHQPIGKLLDSSAQRYLTHKCLVLTAFYSVKIYAHHHGDRLTPNVLAGIWQQEMFLYQLLFVQVLDARNPPLLSVQVAECEHGICCTLPNSKAPERGRILKSYNSAEVDSPFLLTLKHLCQSILI